MPQYPQSPLMGQMMGEPLLISSIIRHADRQFGKNEIVSRRVEGDIHRYTYRDCHRRSRQLANALKKLGVKIGERVATVAWNGYRHMEIVLCGLRFGGRAAHDQSTPVRRAGCLHCQPRRRSISVLRPDRFLPCRRSVFRALHDDPKGYVMLCDREHMPKEQQDQEPDVLRGSDRWQFRRLRVAASFDEKFGIEVLCLHLGHHGQSRKGAPSIRIAPRCCIRLLRSLAGRFERVVWRDVVLPVVPMFHVNAWGLPYSVPLSGAKMVFPGAALDGKSLYELFEQEQVTISAGVPTVWLGLLNYVGQNELTFSTFRRTVIGGSACPPAMMKTLRHKYGVEVVHAWGMTEMSPLGTTCTLQNHHLNLPDDKQQAILEKQGHAIYGVELKIIDDAGKELPWDGKTFGNLVVRGPWIVDGYFKKEGGDVLIDGWFPTGDVATIDPDGYLQITDRSKDVIKSGGEWIGSIDLENIAMAHPAVLQAACIGIFHPKWDERPLLVVVKRPGMELSKDELITFYQGKIAKWWTPDDVVFVDAIPLGATGKVLKTKIREQLKEYVLPTA